MTERQLLTFGKAEGQHRAMRRIGAALLVVVALAPIACWSSDGDNSSAPTARTAAGSVTPARPIPLDQHPAQFAAGGYYFVVHREDSLNWRSMAAYSFQRKQWRKLPTPPDFRSQSGAWDGRRLVLVGLRGCPREEGIRCTHGRPTAAFIEPGGGRWRIVDLGLGEVEVSPETGWDMSAIAGADGRTYLLDERGRVVRLTDSGHLIPSAEPPGGIPCLVGDQFIAIASQVGPERPSSTPLTPANSRIRTLPLGFASQERWSTPAVSLPPNLAEPAAEARPVCGAKGVVLLDVINQRALTWEPGATSWRLVTNLGDGPLDHDTADLMKHMDNGDLVGVERRPEAHYIFRLHLSDATGVPHWSQQEAEWVRFDLVGEKVLVYPDQRPTQRDRRTWRLSEVAL